MIYPVVVELAADGIAVAVACRVLGVSTSGFYEWRSRPASLRSVADQALAHTIGEIHQMSRGTYGAPRVHAELRLAAGVRCGRKRVQRLMRAAGLQGVYRRRRRGCTVRDPDAQPSADLVQRRFTAERPDALWVCDITQHRTGEGWLYCAVVLDVFARRVVGWSIADHLRSELVIDALDMARWRRRPAAGQTVVHSDHGSQYTSWAFGHRLRTAGLLGSMQLELLDRQQWHTRQELANAIFEWIEAWYNPRRRHSALGNLSPVDYERHHASAATAA